MNEVGIKYIFGLRICFMAKIVKKYPFSEYYSEKEPLSHDQQEAADYLIELIHRRKSVDSFCNRFPKSSKREVQLFLDTLDVVSINRPLEEKEKKEFLQDLATVLHFVPESDKVAKRILNEVHGYILLQQLFDDDELEEIMVNGIDQVFAYHRKYGICKTNLKFESIDQLQELISQMGFEANAEYADLRLADGSRANIIVPTAVKEPSITVRKFRQKPFSVIELIEKQTLNPELGAYLWVAIEGLIFFPLNIMVAGGTAAGKTTTLNALSSFIPASDRIVTIEDTPELNFFERENWVQMVTTDRIDLPGLLKNCLRMRPDRILVGDIRGEEATTLFTAMNTGHRGAMGTLHANNDRDAIKRLENEPMSVPRSMIPLADIIMIQHRVYDRRHGLIRRVTHVSEISRLEDEIALNPVFTWNFETDDIERTKFSSEAIEKLARMTHLNKNEVKAEMEDRQRILEYLQEKKISKQVEINKFMEKYYEKVFAEADTGEIQAKAAAAKRETLLKEHKKVGLS
ncbi:MAG: ATPase, T2SS/T4P/T4SS family [Candidatus Micrarchaeota archaeon]